MDTTEAEAYIHQQALAIDLLQELGAGWKRISRSSGADFDRRKLQDIADWVNIYWLITPLIKRVVCQSYFVSVKDPDV